uniref:DUF4203 domain-containing protein n=1 Tax=Micromonas pusilla TaxID=38833 RepID=A0A7S0KDJ1_MICPS|mmetsp:Transcript_11471/g.44598  ORF Transcript_11471/g.44598 Transcript_11471/m.44598 type:complete len:345 (+) Transcript_11471:55-1089(+)
MSFGLDLNQAIKNVQIAKAAHKSFKAAAKVGVSEAEADANCEGPDCDGYDVLRKKVDDCLEAQIDLKQKLNAAEAAGDLAATQAVSEEMAALNEQCTEFWEQEALGHGPVRVTRNRPYPDEEAFGFQEVMALVVLATSILFITHGAKFHKFLICAVGMTIGTFGGLFLTEQFGITEFKPKWGVSLALGLALWIAVMFVEQLMFSAVAMGIGGGGMMIIYSFVGHYIPPQPEYYMFVAIGIGCVAGYFLTDMVKKAALTLIYSVLGGVLLGSAVSFTFWKYHLAHGDLWLENITSNDVTLDLTQWPVLVSIGTMVAGALFGIWFQNKSAKKAEKEPLLKKGDDTV